MELLSTLRQTLEPSIDAMGYDIVDLRLSEGKRSATLTIMAERKDGVGMMVEDCERISRQTSALLDVEDPIQTAYNLEVCSPGIDRPLTRLKDFQNYLTHEAKVETTLPIEGRKRFRGFLVEVEGDIIYLNVAGLNERQPIAFHNIRSAKLVFNGPVDPSGHGRARPNPKTC